MGIAFMVHQEDFQNISDYSDLKQIYMETVNLIPEEDIQQLWNKATEQELITVYHGTATTYLNSIFQQGIKPRQESAIDNWEHNQSNPRMVYLTNKWHYFYAENAVSVRHESTGTENDEVDPEIYPCYIECKIPKALLMIDEDFIYSSYFRTKFTTAVRKHRDFLIDGEECLAQYGTVGIIGGIPASAIRSFTIMKNGRFFTDPNSQYMSEYHAWQRGKGKGKLKLRDLMKMEESTYENGTWFLNQFSGPPVIGRVFMNPASGKIAISAKNVRTPVR